MTNKLHKLVYVQKMREKETCGWISTQWFLYSLLPKRYESRAHFSKQGPPTETYGSGISAAESAPELRGVGCSNILKHLVSTSGCKICCVCSSLVEFKESEKWLIGFQIFH